MSNTSFRVTSALCLPLLFLAAGGCDASELPAATVQQASTVSNKPQQPGIWMSVGGSRFHITLSDSQAARDFAAQLPLTLTMADLNGNEKHGELPRALPEDASSPGTIRSGDLMLYGAKTLVIFYKTFESSYSYTPLGRMDNPAGLVNALGRGSARVVFSRQ